MREICGDRSCTVVLSRAELATGVLLNLLKFQHFISRFLIPNQGVAGSSPAGVANEVNGLSDYFGDIGQLNASGASVGLQQSPDRCSLGNSHQPQPKP